MNPKIKELEHRNPDLEALLPAWQQIYDVLNDQVIDPKKKYLPRGKLEPESEYNTRLAITPWFPDTQQLVTSRLSSLFTTPIAYEGLTARSSAFCENAGRPDQSLADVAELAAQRAQEHGFCAFALDRRPDGSVYTSIFSAPDVYDFNASPSGILIWAKLHERYTRQVAVSAKAQTVDVYRIYSQSNLELWEVFTPEGKEPVATLISSGSHGFNDIPVIIYSPITPFPDIPRPMLSRAAGADIAATRVLSDIVWTLYLVGNPILTYRTQNPDQDIIKLENLKSRYVPLKAGRPGISEPDELKFVKLDATGTEFLFRLHELCVNQATKHTTTGPDAALPTQQSAAAQLARFMLNEGRTLEKLARSLEKVLARVILRATGDTVTVKVTELQLATTEAPQGAKKNPETGGQV